MGKRNLGKLFLLIVLISLFGCSSLQASSKFQSKHISLSTYADEIGFSLHEPTQGKFDVEASFQLDGYVEDYSGMEFPHLWVIAQHEDNMEESFSHYFKLDEGEFSETMPLPLGKGTYDISIRAPGEGSGDKLTYYDVAAFTVNNLTEHDDQVAEYTRFGAENELQLSEIEASDYSVNIEGIVAQAYAHDKVLIEVRQDENVEQIVWPINDFTFSGEVPLYFDQGMHEVHIQLHNETDDYYYSSGIIHVEKTSDKQFAAVETYTDYFSSGVALEQPTWSESNELSDQSYKIKGTINPDKNPEQPIEHIIVTMTYLDEDLESGYIIPVENNTFEDDVYFRFGPGTYDVKINIPDEEKTDQSMFYYRTIAKMTHDVSKISDERGLLPSRGIESEDPTIVSKAEEITAHVNSEREQAKAIYEYVAQNIAYDVHKAEEDLFEVSDSALSTLLAESGICQDYAFLTTALLRAIGLEAHYVSGHAGDRHAWVETKVDGEWIEMDPTWGAGYIYEGEFYFDYNETYFDPDPYHFEQTHTREEVMY